METKMRSLQLNGVWELVVKLIYCAIENIVAEIFTKGLSIRQFEKLQHLTSCHIYLQFKLDRTREQHGSTLHIFHFTHMQACMCTQV